MISARIVSRVLRRKNPHAPIGLMIGAGELLNHAPSLIVIELLKPQRNRAQDARNIGAVAICVERVSVDSLFSGPEGLVEKRLLPVESLLQLFAEIFFTHEMSEVRKRACSFEAEGCLVELGPHRIEWSSLDPASAHAEVLCQSLRVVRRSEKLVSFREVVPFLLGESNVSAVRHIIVRGYDEQRRSVGRGIGIRCALEPIRKGRTLSDFVRDL